MNIVEHFHSFAMKLPLKSPPVMVGHPLIGRIGECVPGRGFNLKYMTTRTFEALLRDEEKFRRNPKLALREAGIITTWDGVLAARAGGKADDFLGFKLSQATSANKWFNFYRSGGLPPAGTYTNIPGGAVMNNASTGAFPLRSPGAEPERKYLINFGVQHLTGTNVVLLVDLLVAAGNILLTTTAAQTVNSVALTRYTDGAGVMMAFEITTATSATAVDITISYTNQAGTSGRSVTTAFQPATAQAVFKLCPDATAPITALQAGDFGVRSVQTVTFSAALTAGVCALLLYRPLLLIPTIATTTYVERSTPGMLGGITELVKETAANTIGCLTVFVLTSTTSTGVQTYFIQTCAG